MFKLHPVASVLVLSACVVACGTYIGSSTLYSRNVTADTPARHHSLRFSTVTDYPLDWSGIAPKIRPGSAATVQAVMKCCNAPFRLFSAMLTVLWSLSVEKCAHTGHVVGVSAYPSMLQAAGSWLLWGVFHLPVLVACRFISIMAVFVAVPYLLFSNWRLLSSVPGSFLEVVSKLHACAGHQAAASDDGVTSEDNERPAHGNCDCCSQSSCHGDHPPAPSCLKKLAATIGFVCGLVLFAVHMTCQSCTTFFIRHVTAPLLHSYVKHLSRAASHLVVFTWWCSPRTAASSLRCVQFCAAAVYVWALRSCGVAIDTVPKQQAGCGRRKRCSVRAADAHVGAKITKTSGEMKK